MLYGFDFVQRQVEMLQLMKFKVKGLDLVVTQIEVLQLRMIYQKVQTLFLVAGQI